MASNVKPIPEGFHTITPHIIVRDAAKSIDFYKKAFAAEEVFRMPGPDGHGVMHAEIRIGDSHVMICDEQPYMKQWRAPESFGGTTVALALYVEDADKCFQRAVQAGATASMAMMDAFWGDRYGKVTDPFGHEWEIMTHKEDLTPEQIQKNAEAFFANAGGGGCGAH
ncbi:MAG: VOC family protein [Phycisphaerae bacterium]